ncbi:MAG TPA: hypothetical protein VFF04_06830 [Candidatus Babeliales bacterium]|nr:hypothetical protein [Candidatus Babeliales bacterium]
MKKQGIIMPEKGLLYGYIIPLLTVILFIILIAITIINVYYRSRVSTGEIIAGDIEQLAHLFKDIENSCEIIDFDSQITPINFLTVKKGGFIGSTIGSMNVRYPEKWKGPYVQENPEVQGIPYQIVKTDNGYFITPGNGVVLPNRKTVGKEIFLDEQADIQALIQDKEGLRYEDKPLAAKIDTHPITTLDVLTAEDIGEDMASAQQQWLEENNKSRSGAQLAMN